MSKQLIKSANYLFIALILAAIFAFVAHFPILLDPFAVDEDFRTLFWMNRFQEPSLFARLSLDSFGLRELQLGPRRLVIESSSPGYSLLFYVASFVIPPLTFSKILVFPLLLTAVFFIYRIGEFLKGPKTALILSLLFTTFNLAADSEISVIAGLHRSFVTPFLLALLFYLLTERYRAAAVVLFFCGIIYLPIFPVCAITYLFSIVRVRENGRWHLKIHRQPAVYMLLVLILVGLAIAPVITNIFDRAAETTTVAEDSIHILNDPEFKTGGRRPLFKIAPFVGRGGIASHLIGSFQIFLLSILVLFIRIIRRKKMDFLPQTFMNLFIASLVGFTLAWISIILTSSFIFYIPSRHTQSSFFILVLILVGVNLEGTISIIMQWVLSHRRQFIWYLLPVILLAFGLVARPPEVAATILGSNIRILLMILTLTLFILAVFVARRNNEPDPNRTRAYMPNTARWRMTLLFFVIFSPLYISIFGSVRGNHFTLSEEEKQLMSFISTLPKDSLIGGDPCQLDNVQQFGKRLTLFSCERYQFLNSPGTVQAMLAAYYADNGESVAQFCQEYGVDYFIIDKMTFSEEFLAAGNFFYEPYDSWLKKRLAEQSRFALSEINEEDMLFQVGSTFIIPCQAETLLKYD